MESKESKVPRINKGDIKKKGSKRGEVNKEKYMTKLIVRNLHYNTEKVDLEKEFRRFGEIRSIALKCSKKKHTGYAFIHYKDKNAVIRAISHQKQIKFLGRAVTYAAAMPHKEFKAANPEDPNKIATKKKIKEKVKDDINCRVLVCNIAYNTSKKDVKAALEPFGTMSHFSFLMDKETNRHKGSAFVTFSSKEEADNILKKSKEVPVVVKERSLIFFPAKPNKSAAEQKQPKQ